MSGNLPDRLLLDTNAIIGILRGHSALLNRAAQAEWIGASVISYIEFLAFPDISPDDQALFKRFLSRIDVIDLAFSKPKLIDLAIYLRQMHRIKLPDAIIVAAAIDNDAILITNDQQLLTLCTRCSELRTAAF